LPQAITFRAFSAFKLRALARSNPVSRSPNHPPQFVVNEAADLITLFSEGGFGSMLAPASQNSSSTEAKFRLLYLGNDLKLIAALRQALAEPVYQLVTCSDRESAMLFLKSEIPYEVLLVDFEWRKKDGVEIARLARKLRHRRRMPIVLLAGARLSRQRRAAAAKAGVQECVLKTQDVGEAIKRVMGLET
jgi:PleD family two-component response regulator